MQSDNIIKSDERAIFALRSLYKRYGYSQYKMSRFEEYDLYVRNKDFLVSDEVITFTDRKGRLLALKPDVTLSIIKNTTGSEGISKFYYNENVYRVSQGTDNFKEIMQAGLECIGDLTPYEISEVVLLSAKSLELISPDWVLDISHMGLIVSMLESANLSHSGKKEAFTYLNQKNGHQLRDLCEREGVSEENTEKLLLLTTLSGKSEEVLSKLQPLMQSEEEIAYYSEFSALFEVIRSFGLEDKVKIDFSVGNNMKYYSGVVLNGYISGIPSCVLSGGQYDRLLQKMKKSEKAIGFAIYLDLLERFEEEKELFDVDVLLLSEGTDTLTLLKTAEKLSKDTSVLVSKEIPQDIKYRRLMKITEGEVNLLEENG